MIEHEETRKAFVIYIPKQGFMKNRQGNFTESFAYARLFSNKNDANNCLMHDAKPSNQTRRAARARKLENAHIIPVDITLDPKQVFATVLKGSR